jgi:uncharacterized membrane protein
MPVPVSVLPSVIVRWLHLVAAASVLGGAGLAWWLLRDATRTGDAGRAAAALSASQAYEWGFWTAVGVIVATGVGNLGALAPVVPGPDTGWGTMLSLKLVFVLVLLVGSVVRTMLVAGPTAGQPVEAPSGRAIGPRSERAVETGPERFRADAHRLAVLRSAYAVTAVWLLAIVGFAEVLAHG